MVFIKLKYRRKHSSLSGHEYFHLFVMDLFFTALKLYDLIQFVITTQVGQYGKETINFRELPRFRASSIPYRIFFNFSGAFRPNSCSVRWETAG